MKSENIEYVQLGNSGILVSKVCLGTWAIGGWMWGGSEEDESIRTIHAALDRGVKFIDTAPVYGFGRSEEIVGKALKGHVERESVIIGTKAGLEWDDKGRVFRNSTRQRILKEVDDSLRRLQTEYIDLYQIHWPDPLTPIEETAQVMGELLKAGKIRAVGVSNYTAEQMDAFRKVAPLHSVQSPYNLFERQIEEDVVPYAKKHGITVLAYGSICRGLLSGKMKADTPFQGDDLRQHDPKFRDPRFVHYLNAVAELENMAVKRHGRHVLELAIRWVLDQGAIALWGARHPAQLDPVAQVFGWSLTDQDLKDIDDVIHKNIPTPVGPEFMAPPSRDRVKH
ncbi:MAG: aldo/keto reductase [Desulfuromonadaceae bacterium]|nr:aldo/keto reductase [Desulfuromonadaceae bacterium]MDD2849608.1 aldo/keto reductase [Desulfuromonadaceae bacterium]MDD4130933.1 aldo/keto reductase [Desulfuromonadaceae bacterium]